MCRVGRASLRNGKSVQQTQATTLLQRALHDQLVPVLLWSGIINIIIIIDMFLLDARLEDQDQDQHLDVVRCWNWTSMSSSQT
jgi:hypothetical protein